jgi:hypothetical protein
MEKDIEDITRFPTHAGAGQGAGSAIKGKKVEEGRGR